MAGPPLNGSEFADLFADIQPDAGYQIVPHGLNLAGPGQAWPAHQGASNLATREQGGLPLAMQIGGNNGYNLAAMQQQYAQQSMQRQQKQQFMQQHLMQQQLMQQQQQQLMQQQQQALPAPPPRAAAARGVKGSRGGKTVGAQRSTSHGGAGSQIRSQFSLQRAVETNTGVVADNRINGTEWS